MASSSSDESCKAPENFQVSSTSNEDDDDDDFCAEGKITSLRQSRVQLRKATTFTKHKRSLGNSESNLNNCLRCPLCYNRRERFHCRSCVKNGNITKSQQQQCDSESLSEKQQKFMQTQAKIKALSSKYEQIIQETKASENINFEVKRKQEQLTLISSLIDNKLQRISSLKEKHTELRKANADKRKTLPAYDRKVKALEQYVLDRVEKIERLREKHKTILEQLKQTSRNGIQQLVEYIFPITEIVLKDELQQRRENCKTEDLETIAALAEAKNTSYIRGKWVFHGSGISEVQYRIVAASLPANGDYSAYLDWLTDNKDDVPKSTAIEILPSRVMAFRIMGALTYTTQLTQLISYFLNVRLPHKLAYGDFCRKLNEEQFMRKVSRLNSNIMYLAYTQHVQLRPLNENHTLENLLTILDVEKSDLGRQGCHEVGNAPLMRSVDSLLFGIETATESESEDENSLRLDWESVPPSLAVTPSDALAVNTGLPLNQQSRIAEGLVTSAANRLTSMLRWMK